MGVVCASVNNCSSLCTWQSIVSSRAGCWLSTGLTNHTRKPGASSVDASSYCISDTAIAWMTLHVQHPVSVLCAHPPKAACLAASGLAAHFITASRSAFGVAGEWGGFKCLGVCPQLLQTSPPLLQSEAEYLSRWLAAAFAGVLKRQDRCSSHFRFPLLIEISDLPENNNCCQWQLLQFKMFTNGLQCPD